MLTVWCDASIELKVAFFYAYTATGQSETASNELEVNFLDQDHEDVRRVLEGDASAFEGIVRRWQRPLINLAFRFCRNRQIAEEMAQDAFLHIFKNLRKFRAEGAFSTWIFAVSLNLYRSSLRRKSLPIEPIDTLAEIPGERFPHLTFEREEREELVRRAVLALPPRYRDAVIVFYFREMDMKETAAILDVPEGTVKSWLHRGRELLKDKLGTQFSRAGVIEEVVL